MQYFDFHTHNKKTKNSLINLFHNELPRNSGKFSIGIHPWHIDKEQISVSRKKLEEVAQQNSVLAIGECGLDKNTSADFELQKDIFRFHIDLSERLQKPLIIHCVGYYNELINLKNQVSPKQTWILHGYNKNVKLLEKLVQNGFYFSIGGKLAKNTDQLNKILNAIPQDRLLVETDDSDFDIVTLYNILAKIMNIDIEYFENQVLKNVEKVLNIKTS